MCYLSKVVIYIFIFPVFLYMTSIWRYVIELPCVCTTPHSLARGYVTTQNHICKHLLCLPLMRFYFPGGNSTPLNHKCIKYHASLYRNNSFFPISMLFVNWVGFGYCPRVKQNWHVLIIFQAYNWWQLSMCTKCGLKYIGLFGKSLLFMCSLVYYKFTLKLKDFKL